MKDEENWSESYLCATEADFSDNSAEKYGSTYIDFACVPIEYGEEHRIGINFPKGTKVRKGNKTDLGAQELGSRTRKRRKEETDPSAVSPPARLCNHPKFYFFGWLDFQDGARYGWDDEARC